MGCGGKFTWGENDVKVVRVVKNGKPVKNNGKKNKEKKSK